MEIAVEPAPKFAKTTFPWVGECDQGASLKRLICMFISQDSAIILQHNSPAEVGRLIGGWDRSKFTEFRGKVTFICH